MKICHFLKSVFCFSTCPFAVTSRTTRAFFFVLFAIHTTVTTLWSYQLLPIDWDFLPFCGNGNSTKYLEDCIHFPQHLATYRSSFAFFLFFFLMFLVMIHVLKSRDSRTAVQNGCWFFKAIFLALLLLGTFHLPVGAFDSVMMITALVASLIFNTFELLTFMQLSHNFTKCLVILWFQGSYVAFSILLAFSLICINAALLIAFFLLMFYENCTMNLFSIITHSITGYSLLIGSIFIEQVNHRIGILQGGVMSTHVMMLTWSAITNNPEPECFSTKPSAYLAFQIVNHIGIIRAWFTVIFVTIHNSTTPPAPNNTSTIHTEERGGEFCGVWGRNKIIKTEAPETTEAGTAQTVRYLTTDEHDDEYEAVKYNWSKTHCIYATATLYLMLSLTEWYVPGWPRGDIIHINSTAMWFKIATCWVCFVTYLHLICIPRVAAG